MRAQAFIPPSMADLQPVAHSPTRTRGAEAWALILFFAGSFLVLALASVRIHPSDPSVNGADWMGPVGASLAGLLVEGFGAAAWWVPLEFFLIGAPLLRGRRPEVVALRVSGDLLVLVLVASLLQVALPNLEVSGFARSGGNVGLFFGELSRGLFSAPGSFLVGMTGIGLIFIGRSSFSFIQLCERLMNIYRSTVRGLHALLLNLGAVWKRASLERQEESRIEAMAPAIQPLDPDAAILHHLECDTPWIPLEATGAPPLEVSESLRSAFRLFEEEDEFEEAEPQIHDLELESDRESPDSADGFWQGISGEDSPEVPGLDSTEDPPPIEEDEYESPNDGVDPAFGLSQPESDEPPEAAGGEEPKIVEMSSIQATRAARPEQKMAKEGSYVLPPTDLLDPPEENEHPVDRRVLLRYADLLEKTLADYGVTGKVEEIHPGPTVTTYEVAPLAGTKVSKVAGLSDDLALGLSRKVRIIAPIPGKSRIGFEIPNDERVPVNLRELVEERFAALSKKAPLPVVLGRDIVGAPFYADLASMPHVIVAGATGAGKSVGLNVMLSSLLFKRAPEDLRLLMIDPKVVELAPFDRIPHLLLPVVTDMNQAAQALKWAVDEMERRYQLFADAGTKNISTYNRYAKRVRDGELPPPKVTQVEVIDYNGDLSSAPVSKKGSDGFQLPEKLPYIVIVVDEFADLMMQQGKEVEVSVARLAQKARAAGMHVILATQRPSVDVITGMIKANFPSRIAFRVAQKVDSRTILDEQGAEVLLGKGDKLVKLNGSTDTLRVQCPFISEEEVSALTDHIRAQAEPQYDEAILLPEEDCDVEDADEKVDTRFDEAVLIVRDSQRCSTSWLQRKMTIGYNRAAKIVDMMERRGMVGPPNGSKDREVLLMP
jgi:S-DNA-T family DNA segregation ATPase FtsK/SpoIIIE